MGKGIAGPPGASFFCQRLSGLACTEGLYSNLGEEGVWGILANISTECRGPKLWGILAHNFTLSPTGLESKAGARTEENFQACVVAAHTFSFTTLVSAAAVVRVVDINVSREQGCHHSGPGMGAGCNG